MSSISSNNPASMSSVSFQQQVFALDAKYNANRTCNSPNFRTLYIRRRSQLLREKVDRDSATWSQYLTVREQLLEQKYSATAPKSTDSTFSSAPLRTVDGAAIAGSLMSLSLDNSIGKNYAFAGVHHIFDQHSKAVTSVKFANNDRTKLCCASVDGTLSICDVSSVPGTVLATLQEHTQPVTGFDWSTNNDLIVSSSLDGTIRLWSVSSCNCLRTISEPNATKILCCMFHQINDNLIIAGTSDGEISVVNVSTGRFLKRSCKMGGNVLSLASDATGNFVWAGNDQGDIISIQCDVSGSLVQKRRLFIGCPCSITSISYRAWISRKARDPTLLINCSNNSVILFSVTNNGQLKLKRRFQNKHQKHLVKSIFCPIISFREGACIVSGSEDCNVYFINIEKHQSKAFINKLQGHAAPVLSVSFNYNESLLASSDLDGLVIVWKREHLEKD